MASQVTRRAENFNGSVEVTTDLADASYPVLIAVDSGSGDAELWLRHEEVVALIEDLALALSIASEPERSVAEPDCGEG